MSDHSGNFTRALNTLVLNTLIMCVRARAREIATRPYDPNIGFAGVHDRLETTIILSRARNESTANRDRLGCGGRDTGEIYTKVFSSTVTLVNKERSTLLLFRDLYPHLRT